MNIKVVLILLAASVLTGCASGPIGAHQPTMESIQVLRQSNMEPVAVGEFVPATELTPARDKSVSVRGSSLKSPVSDSFSAYLKDSLAKDLRAAGKYDEAAPTVISGKLTHNELNAAGMSKADSTIAAKIAVTRGGTTLFDKLISVTHEWPSAFMGAIAIPDAINQYTQMYTRLLDKLFADEEFKAAVAAQ